MAVDNPPKLNRADEIRSALLANVDAHSADLITYVAKQFDVSRQAVHRQVRRLIASGELVAEGDRRHTRYRKRGIERELSIPLDGSVEEDRVWETFALPVLKDIKPNVLRICNHGFTEMVNNAIDHSEADTLFLSVERTPEKVELIVSDNGVGIFNKIQKACDLDSPEQAIFELSKGKLTTDPARHSGEGIFFTSRIFDQFSILSEGLWFGHVRERPDMLTNNFSNDGRGTTIFMEIALDSTHTTQDVFDAYSTTQDGMVFDKTIVALQLAKSGPLVSRSQAKRVLTRLNNFKEVVLDFKEVSEMGQAFADEIFRVYKKAHPAVRVIGINANEAVQRMISRASLAGQREAVRHSAFGIAISALVNDPEFRARPDGERLDRFRSAIAEFDQGRLESFDALPPDQQKTVMGFLIDAVSEGGELSQE